MTSIPPAVDAVVASVTRLLRTRGERMTAPRRAVLVALAGSDRHLTVDQVAARVADVDDGVHLASVYRALEVFGRLGVVQHVHLGHGSTAYHLLTGDDPHPHAQCSRCQRVWDLPRGILDPVRDELAGDGFTLDAHHVALSGVCAACVDPDPDRGEAANPLQ